MALRWQSRPLGCVRQAEVAFRDKRSSMKILIAHEWALIRAGILQILCDEFGPVEVTQASTVLEGFDLATGPWDLAIVGVDDTDSRGLQFVAGLKRAHPRQRVLAVSRRAKVSYVQGILKNLIQGTLTRECTRDGIVTAVRYAITRGDSRKESRGLPGMPPLSKRELEVLRLLAAGKSIKEVAAELKVSASTISTYRVRMLRKLKLGSTGALIRYAFKNHLAD